MPKAFRSPLSEQDMDALEAMSAKANAHGLLEGLSPLYVALDVGDACHRDGYLLLCWPTSDSRSHRCAQHVFDYIRAIAMAEFGATMIPAAPQGVPNAPQG